MKSINDLPEWFRKRDDSLHILFDFIEQNGVKNETDLTLDFPDLNLLRKFRYIVCTKIFHPVCLEFVLYGFDTIDKIKEKIDFIESTHFIYDQEKQTYIELKITKVAEVIELEKGS